MFDNDELHKCIYEQNIWICEKQLLLFKIEISHIDFEIDAIETTKEIFPAVQIETYRFHLGQV